MLLLFAISGNSQIGSISEQTGDEDEAVRRMGSYIQGCNNCDGKCGFPTGDYKITLKSPSSGQELNVQFTFNDGIDAITGVADWEIGSQESGQIVGYHDCEHAYFTVEAEFLFRRQSKQNFSSADSRSRISKCNWLTDSDLKNGYAKHGEVDAQRFQKWLPHAHLVPAVVHPMLPKYITEC